MATRELNRPKTLSDLDSSCNFTIEKAQELINSIKNENLRTGSAQSKSSVLSGGSGENGQELGQNNSSQSNSGQNQNSGQNSDQNQNLVLFPAKVAEITFNPNNKDQEKAETQEQEQDTIKNSENNRPRSSTSSALENLTRNFRFGNTNLDLNTSNSTLDSNSSLTNQDSARNSATSGVQGSGSDNTVKNANQNQFTAAFGQQLQAQMAQAQAVQQAAQVQAVQAAQAQAAQVAQAAQMAQAQVQAQAQAAQAQATLSQPNRGNISPETEFLFKAVPQLIEKVQLLYTELEQEKTKRGILESKVEWMTKRIDLLEAWKKQHEKVENGGAVTPNSSKANEALRFWGVLT